MPSDTFPSLHATSCLFTSVLDYLHVMTYDFHVAVEHNVGENSPLYKGPADQGSMIYFNVVSNGSCWDTNFLAKQSLTLLPCAKDYAMNYWKSNGAPAEKLLVGFPTYGHVFHLASSNTAVGAPASGPGPAGPFTRQSGFWSYYEVRTFISLAVCICTLQYKLLYSGPDLLKASVCTNA